MVVLFIILQLRYYEKFIKNRMFSDDAVRVELLCFTANNLR